MSAVALGNCAVCSGGSDKAAGADPLVSCSTCNLVTHVKCLGSRCLRAPWAGAADLAAAVAVHGRVHAMQCAVCREFGTTETPACILCGSAGRNNRAMRQAAAVSENLVTLPRGASDFVEGWCHVTCVLSDPHASFRNHDAREGVIGIAAVPKERWMARCTLCASRRSAAEVAAAAVDAPPAPKRKPTTATSSERSGIAAASDLPVVPLGECSNVTMLMGGPKRGATEAGAPVRCMHEDRVGSSAAGTVTRCSVHFHPICGIASQWIADGAAPSSGASAARTSSSGAGAAAGAASSVASSCGAYYCGLHSARDVFTANAHDSVSCRMCGTNSGGAKRSIRCDGCDAPFHFSCLSPALDRPPVGASWYCGLCTRKRVERGELLADVALLDALATTDRAAAGCGAGGHSGSVAPLDISTAVVLSAEPPAHDTSLAARAASTSHLEGGHATTVARPLPVDPATRLPQIPAGGMLSGTLSGIDFVDSGRLGTAAAAASRLGGDAGTATSAAGGAAAYSAAGADSPGSGAFDDDDAGVDDAAVDSDDDAAEGGRRRRGKRVNRSRRDGNEALAGDWPASDLTWEVAGGGDALDYNPPHQLQAAVLDDAVARQAVQWQSLVYAGHSLLLYGIGSKRDALQAVAARVGADIPVLLVDGLKDTASGRSIAHDCYVGLTSEAPSVSSAAGILALLEPICGGRKEDDVDTTRRLFGDDGGESGYDDLPAYMSAAAAPGAAAAAAAATGSDGTDGLFAAGYSWYGALDAALAGKVESRATPPTLLVAVMNADAVAARDADALPTLMDLASLKGIACIIAVDSLAPTAWTDYRDVAAGRWLVADCTTFAPYREDASTRSKASVVSRRTQRTVVQVLSSLTRNHREVLKCLLTLSFPAGTNDKAAAIPVSMTQLLEECAKTGVLGSQQALNLHLVELYDHKLVVQRSGGTYLQLRQPRKTIDEALKAAAEEAGEDW